MAQDKTLRHGEGLDMGENDKGEGLFQDLFNQAQEAINKVYLPGTIAYIQENHGSLYGTVLNTERRIEELWLAMKEGKDTLDQFKGVLRVWQDAHLKGIELYMSRDKGQKKLL